MKGLRSRTWIYFVMLHGCCVKKDIERIYEGQINVMWIVKISIPKDRSTLVDKIFKILRINMFFSNCR